MDARSNSDATFNAPDLHDVHNKDTIYEAWIYFSQEKPRKYAHLLFSDEDEMAGSSTDHKYLQTMVKVEPHQADAINVDQPSFRPIALSHVNLKASPVAVSGIGSKGQPKASNYDMPIRQVLETAIELYHTLLLTETPFPNAQQEVEWAKGVWDMACKYHKAKMSEGIDAALIKLVCNPSWSQRYTNKQVTDNGACIQPMGAIQNEGMTDHYNNIHIWDWCQPGCDWNKSEASDRAEAQLGVTNVWDPLPFSAILPSLPSHSLWNMITNDEGISSEIWDQFIGGDVPSITF